MISSVGWMANSARVRTWAASGASRGARWVKYASETWETGPSAGSVSASLPTRGGTSRPSSSCQNSTSQP
ncbi:hypothetical protein A8W25_29780 [Streptomyces sp. ERV7]|nr:hypothetical protein A8W25_29780 [Streptomyces sp. ERV7]